MFLYSQSVEDANNSGMNLLDQSVIKKGMDSSPPPTKVSKVFLCIHVFMMRFHFEGLHCFIRHQCLFTIIGQWLSG